LTGNRIIMSVEVDDNDRPAAYWLTQPPAEWLYGSTRYNRIAYRQRVPASEMIHAFLCNEDESQARGATWLHTAGMTLKFLGEGENAELVNAFVIACNLPYLIPPEGEDEPLPNSAGGDGDPANKPIPRPVEQQVEPGVQRILPPGWDVKEFKPEHPNPNFEAFAKLELRRAAVGLEVAYSSLTGDLESANYSSLKAGRVEEQSSYRAKQYWQAEVFNRVVFWAALKQFRLVGRVQISVADISRLRVQHQGRGWASLEPLKEIQATILAIHNFLDSPIDDAAERGLDWMDIVDKLRKCKGILEEAGFEATFLQPLQTKIADDKTDDTPDGPADEENANADDGTNRVLPALQHQLLPGPRRGSNGHSRLIL
jgi:lambda family phage portal protein